MQQIAVFIKRNGILVPCRAFPQPDGAVWICAECRATVIRSSYGMLNGLYRCVCGCDVELLVDGMAVPLEEGAVQQPISDDEFLRKYEYAKPHPKKLTDDEFLRGCGITADATTEE